MYITQLTFLFLIYVSAKSQETSSQLCPLLTPPHYGKFKGQCLNKVGQKCEIVCNKRFELVGSKVRVCLPTGQWSGMSSQCQNKHLRCPPLSPPSNGKLNGQCKSFAGSECHIKCSSGYTLSHSGQIVCQLNQSWTSPIPSCVKKQPRNIVCPALPALNNGRSFGYCSPGQVNQECIFQCNTGYNLIGNSVIKCNPDGNWSGVQPFCSFAGCPRLSIATNAIQSGSCNPGIPGQTCSFHCAPGYQIIGSPVLTCNSFGQWSGPVPSCQLFSCPNLISQACGTIVGTCTPGVSINQCTFACSNGCSNVGNQVYICFNQGPLIAQPPICQNPPSVVPVTPAQPPAPEPTESSEDEGEEEEDDDDQDEDEDVEDVSEASAVTNCRPFFAPIGGILIGKCKPGEAGERCKLVCSQGYVLYGNEEVVCNPNGRWSSRLGVCLSLKMAVR